MVWLGELQGGATQGSAGSWGSTGGAGAGRCSRLASQGGGLCCGPSGGPGGTWGGAAVPCCRGDGTGAALSSVTHRSVSLRLGLQQSKQRGEALRKTDSSPLHTTNGGLTTHNLHTSYIQYDFILSEILIMDKKSYLPLLYAQRTARVDRGRCLREVRGHGANGWRLSVRLPQGTLGNVVPPDQTIRHASWGLHCRETRGRA